MGHEPLQLAYVSSIYCATIDGVTRAFRFSPDRFAPSHTPFPSLPDTWAIVTARNPMSQPLSERENRHRDNNLLAILRWNDLVSHEAFGMSLDGSWREPSRLIVGLSRDMALRIAREFRQRALVWSEHARTGLIDCPSERWTVRPAIPSPLGPTPLGASRDLGKNPA